jgi:hypothetical protein
MGSSSWNKVVFDGSDFIVDAIIPSLPDNQRADYNWDPLPYVELDPGVTTTTTSAPTTTTTPTGAFTPVAYVRSTGSSFTVPTGATSMKVWVIGSGGGGGYGDTCDSGDDGGYGGLGVKTFNVTGGGSVSYSLGSGGSGSIYGGAASATGGSTTATYGGVTVTATGGKGGDYIKYSTDGSWAAGAGTGVGGDFNTGMIRDAYGYYPADYQGLLAAISLSGGSIGVAGLGGLAGSSSPSNGYPGEAGAVVLYFT